jgi:DNA mismatch repair protein MutL
MSIIRILSEKVASQIAAGEVIERPASVVKELIDNSIDAEADRISVSIEKGGKARIRVADNGVGMTKDDLLLCVERHATSKIEGAEDLFSVGSLGFRGEALPSMASVARMEITSRPRDHLAGYRLKIAGGKLEGIEETGTPAGTTVEMRDLFFNVPARRKFLRGVKTETDRIIDAVSRAALPYPRIGFKLEDGEKVLLNLPASEETRARLHHLMGRKVAEAMDRAEETNRGVRVRAFLAPPHFARSRGDRLYIYVNGRHIRDRLVTRAVMEGYGQRLMKGQYPQAAIFLEMDPSAVDVNVHPTKQEVRFHDSRPVFECVRSAVDKALARPFHDFAGPRPRGTEAFPPPRQDAFIVSEPDWAYADRGAERPAPHAAPATGGPELRESPLVIGQLGRTYILCQTRDGLLMLDQHAAHERILYETLRRGFRKAQVEIQTFLLPHRLELSTKEKRILLEKGDTLSGLGLDVEHFGGNTFILRAAPASLENVDWDAFVSELVGALEEGGADADAIHDRVLTVMACHGAIRAGHLLSMEEMTRLLEQLDEMELPTHCPHGRPISRRLSYGELEKMFKRVV